MSSRFTAAMLAVGIAFPAIPALYEIPVLGPVITQAYNGLPANIQSQIPGNIRAQLAPASAGQAGVVNTVNTVNTANAQAQLDALIRDVQGRHQGRATVAVAGDGVQLTAGDNRAEPAFSTMKVPVAIGALRKSPASYLDAEIAITRSDNPAAHRMFAQVSGAELNGIIAEAGSRTTNSAGYQMGTMWTTSDQAAFASGLRCVNGHEPVLGMMGRVVDYQRWGLGRIPGARFKGGWNDHENGHLARQFGLIPGPNGDIAVAITAYSPAGYQESFAMLNGLADGVAHISGTLPTSRC